jgi:hypothetical protein
MYNLVVVIRQFERRQQVFYQHHRLMLGNDIQYFINPLNFNHIKLAFDFFRHFGEFSFVVIRNNEVTGLAWTSVGGDLLTIEATAYKGKGKLNYTGQLGDVMKESIQAAMS